MRPKSGKALKEWKEYAKLSMGFTVGQPGGLTEEKLARLQILHNKYHGWYFPDFEKEIKKQLEQIKMWEKIVKEQKRRDYGVRS